MILNRNLLRDKRHDQLYCRVAFVADRVAKFKGKEFVLVKLNCVNSLKRLVLPSQGA